VVDLRASLDTKVCSRVIWQPAIRTGRLPRELSGPPVISGPSHLYTTTTSSVSRRDCGRRRKVPYLSIVFVLRHAMFAVDFRPTHAPLRAQVAAVSFPGEHHCGHIPQVTSVPTVRVNPSLPVPRRSYELTALLAF